MPPLSFRFPLPGYGWLLRYALLRRHATSADCATLPHFADTLPYITPAHFAAMPPCRRRRRRRHCLRRLRFFGFFFHFFFFFFFCAAADCAFRAAVARVMALRPERWRFAIAFDAS